MRIQSDILKIKSIAPKFSQVWTKIAYRKMYQNTKECENALFTQHVRNGSQHLTARVACCSKNHCECVVSKC